MIRIGKIEIVYPCTPEAETWAAELEKEIQAFRAPSPVYRKTGLQRVADTGEPWLVVLCSPEARTDPEINRIIDEYIRAGQRKQILTLLMSGEPADSFPDALIYETLSNGETVEHEPLAANISAPSRQESRKKLKIEKLRILAPILGVSFDELRNRRHRRRMRILLAASGAVLLGAAVFLIYAANKVRVISDQNRELSSQYELAEEARQEAVAQRNAAREQLAETVALKIRDIRADNELVMLLCLEFLPENGLEGELPGLLKGALERICAKGYVPVTGRKAYARTRDIEEEKSPDLRADTEESPAKNVTLTIPGTEDRFATDTFVLKCWSPEYRYAVYTGGGDPTLYTWIRFLDEPEKSYFLCGENGDFANMANMACLPDGTIIGNCRKFSTGLKYSFSCYRYDPIRKTFLPFRDSSPEPADTGDPLPEGWISRYGDETDVAGFYTLDGMQVVLGAVADDHNHIQGLRIYDRNTLRTTGFLEGAKDEIIDIKGTGLCMISKEETFLICRKDPFEPLFETDAEYSDTRYANIQKYVSYSNGTRMMILRVPDGNYSKAVYDLNTGKLLCIISATGMNFDMELTGDGKLLNSVAGTPTLWDLKTGELFASVPESDNSPEAYGPRDEASGLRTSAAINCGTIYEYREQAIPVPEGLEGQIALARDLLNGRELTDDERKEYFLNRR